MGCHARNCSFWLVQDLEPILTDHDGSRNLLAVESGHNDRVELVIVGPLGVVRISTPDERRLADPRVGNPGVLALGSTRGWHAPGDLDLNVREGIFGVQKLVVKFGVLSEEVLDLHRIDTLHGRSGDDIPAVNILNTLALRAHPQCTAAGWEDSCLPCCHSPDTHR